MQTPELSELSPIGYMNSSCGYCHNKSPSSGSYSYYISAKTVTAQYYEDLICRGWRRSGSLLYKPDVRASCCPHYTIRLDAESFKSTKDQRQTQNRFNRYILGDKYIKESARLHPKSKAEAAKRKQEFDLPERIHESEYQTLEKPPDPDHIFKVTLEHDTFTEEKYVLFENYQRIVHKEPPSKISRGGFQRFLCTSPIRRKTQTINGKVQSLGSYHQCYRLDGKLVAIGVLDLLPQAVSAVYFIYHEEIHKWSPGKLSALREASLAVEGDYKWYMMGFYIHNCVKMRYKADYHPQYILDPETYTWDLLDDDFKRQLDTRKYVSLSRDRIEGVPLTECNDTASLRTDEDTVREIEVENMDEDYDNDDDDEDGIIQPPQMPLFTRNIPGILSRSEIEAINLDTIKLRIGPRPGLLETRDLHFWEESTIDSSNSVKCMVAEVVAALGPDLARRMCLVFE